MRRGALVDGLRRQGHDVLHVAECAAGLTDTDVVESARLEGRLLLTEEGFW